MRGIDKVVANNEWGKLAHMNEVPLYTLKDGKIVSEAFFYHVG